MRRIILSEEAATAPMEAAAAIIRGSIVVVPTDTVYGLVSDARNEDAIRKMFAMKERPQEKAFPVFIKDIDMARRYTYISDAKAKFLERVWPGAVIAVFHHKEKLPAALTGGKDTIGIRIPDHPFLSALLAHLNFPLAQTSANVSALPPAKSCEEVERYFIDENKQPDMIIDGGALPGVPSAVIDFTGASPLILRSGMASTADIDRMLGDL